VCLALAFVTGVVAIGDHRNKQGRMNRAELAEWYCTHLDKRCGGPSSAIIERHWNERQRAYEVVVGSLAAIAALGLVAPVRTHRTVRREAGGGTYSGAD
jgi:hypothetical protein